MSKMPLRLPSRCTVYGVPPDSLFIRTLKGKDEKLIAEVSVDNYEKKFCQILGNCVEGIDVKKLTLGDRKYIMLWLAVNSFSKMHTISGVCENCLAKMEIEVDLTKMNVVELPENFKEPYPVTLSDGSIVNLRLFRVSDEIQLAEMEKTSTNTWLYRFALSIVSDESLPDKVARLEEMDSADIAKIRAFHEEYVHGPIMETQYECQKCGGVGVMPIPFRFELFFPSGQKLTRYFGTTG